MAVIRIREHTGEQGSPNAILSFEHGEEFPITISDPFSEAEELQLAWYFEEHLRFPFTRKVQAKAAVGSIITYGEALFGQVFADREAYAIYKDYLQAGLNTVQVEIAGSPQFHALHWEALKDPRLSQPLALQAAMVRKNLQPQALPALVRPSPTIKLLIVTARPSGTRDVGYRTISRPLVESLRNANLRVQVEILRPGTYRALENHLQDVTAKYGEGYYHVIHFDTHGAVFNNKAFLFFEGEQDNRVGSVQAMELANLLRSHQVYITILNACQSGKQIGERETSLGSHLIQAGVQLVLAMGYSVTVSAAELLMRSLYQHLFSGDDLSVAIRHARTELYNNKERRAYFDQKIDLEDWLLPVVYQNQPVQVETREFTPDEKAVWLERKDKEKEYTPPEPQYGFVGRDIDILQIEKHLLTKRNILLVRGMGGAGKTTLLRHLAAWWHTTGFVQRVLYFGYDEKAWTLQQIMTGIAQQLYGSKYYTDFQPLAPAAQQAMLSQDMRGKNHLLILDNLESITGAHLAIQHTLPPDEQAALRSFLTGLAKGHTLVLLGSRGGEDWLAKGTFDDNIYELPGLDPEAASTLADRILERNNATQYRQDEDLRKLIKVLDGFPLALEVVLANLAHQSPTEVLAALQAGDVSIDPKSDSQNKTESILRCIDYSHSNLSPEAQQLLLCLAPFTSVIDAGALDNYTTHLRQQLVLKSLPFERWPEVLQEAENWGLLSPDPEIPRFLRLQPILPYFLRSRLHAPERSEICLAVETAFREHYDQLGGALNGLLNSKDPKQRQVGQMLTSLEYENLVTALNLALGTQVSIYNLYGSLTNYLGTTQDYRRRLELGQMVLAHLEAYPPAKLTGQLDTEFVRVIVDIANRQLQLKDYVAAEASYQKALKLATELEHVDEKERGELKATTYHQLGRVAQEQRQWQQAGQYYQQALQIYIEYDDRYEQADTYHQLGRVAQEQRQWQQAEQYYQQALQIKIEYNDRYAQAGTYHQLGYVAQEQRQWQQAEQYYQQALQIKIEYNDRYAQARTYHQLGYVALEQRQWAQAEQYYQQALQIKIEYNDRYGQASTYGQLGIMARKQEQWMQARDYYLRALEIFASYKDNYNITNTLYNLALLWQSSGDKDLPAAIAPILGTSLEDTEALLRESLKKK
jgi:tetratricopeptide (TPR) repeat protein